MKCVLIADDEPKVRLLVSTIIFSDRYRIIEACDGDEAWELICQHHPDVALLDVRMPGKTGLEVTRSIRGDASLAKTWVILLSAGAQEAEIRSGLEAGADLYVTKPFSLKGLQSAIEAGLKPSTKYEVRSAKYEPSAASRQPSAS